MQYHSPLSLQHISIVSKALSLWERGNVKNHVQEFFISCGHSGASESGMLEEWHKLTKEVLKQLDHSTLPSILSSELIHISKEVGRKIYDWYWHIEHENQFQYAKVGQALKYVEQMYWTQHGTMDEIVILKSSWIGNSSLSVPTVYNMACSYALEECINHCWAQIPQDMRNKCYNDIYRNCHRHILAYWECRRNGRLAELLGKLSVRSSGGRNEFNRIYNRHYSVEENMFRLSVHEGYSEAVKYFWNKLNNEERDRNIVGGISMLIERYVRYQHVEHYKQEKYVEICVFLMSHIEVHHKVELFKEKTIIGTEDDSFDEEAIQYYILEMMLSIWPWQELFIPVLDGMWQYLEDDTGIVCKILQTITSKIKQDHGLGYVLEHSKYRKILHEVWYMMPVTLKRKIEPDNECLELIRDLLDIWDLSSIKLIVSAQEIASIREALIESCSEKYAKLVKEDKYELLEEFIDQILVSEEEKKKFKQKIELLDHFIKDNQYHLANKLLNWQCSSEEEKKIFKNKIDHIGLLRGFIMKGQYELADKFLYWRSSTEEERKSCKMSLQDDKCVHEHIYKLWAVQKKDIMVAVQNSSKFLNWLLESEEVISFKKNKLRNKNELEAVIRHIFIEYDCFEVIDDFLTWCLLPQEEICSLKQKIVDRTAFRECVCCIVRGLLDSAEKFVRWAFNQEIQRDSFIREFIMSDDGIASCNTFIKRVSDASVCVDKPALEEKFNKFIDFWIKPLENIDDFQRKLHSSEYYNYEEQAEGYSIFEDLLTNLRQNRNIAALSHVKKVTQRINTDVVGHSK